MNYLIYNQSTFRVKLLTIPVYDNVSNLDRNWIPAIITKDNTNRQYIITVGTTIMAYFAYENTSLILE